MLQAKVHEEQKRREVLESDLRAVRAQLVREREAKDAVSAHTSQLRDKWVIDEATYVERVRMAEATNYATMQAVKDSSTVLLNQINSLITEKMGGIVKESVQHAAKELSALLLSHMSGLFTERLGDDGMEKLAKKVQTCLFHFVSYDM